MGKKIEQVKKELLTDGEFRREYDALEEEFSIAAQLIEARTKANRLRSRLPFAWARRNPAWRDSNLAIRCRVCGR